MRLIWPSLLLAVCVSACSESTDSTCGRWCSEYAECLLRRTEINLPAPWPATCEAGGEGRASCVEMCDLAVSDRQSVEGCADCLATEFAAGAGSSGKCSEATARCASLCRANDMVPNDATRALLAGQECWFGDARPAAECPAQSAFIQVSIGGLPERERQMYVGTATVSGVSPLVFSAEGASFTLEVQGAQLPLLAIGTEVELDLQQFCPFWCAASVVLRNSSGGLIFAAWSGPPYPPIETVEYVPSECRGVNRMRVSEMDLDLRLSDGTRIPPGGEHRTTEFRYINGNSAYAYVILQSDTPEAWGSGAVERLLP